VRQGAAGQLRGSEVHRRRRDQQEVSGKSLTFKQLLSTAVDFSTRAVTGPS
jgi:hypothetical protein